jgi:hypothetical protein
MKNASEKFDGDFAKLWREEWRSDIRGRLSRMERSLASLKKVGSPYYLAHEQMIAYYKAALAATDMRHNHHENALDGKAFTLECCDTTNDYQKAQEYRRLIAALYGAK